MKSHLSVKNVESALLVKVILNNIHRHIQVESHISDNYVEHDLSRIVS